jgi:hypothetical protein
MTTQNTVCPYVNMACASVTSHVSASSDSVCGCARLHASWSPLLLSQTYVKSWADMIRLHSPEVSFLKFSNNSKHKISMKWFLHFYTYGTNIRQIFVGISVPRTWQGATLNQTEKASSCTIPVSQSVTIVTCLQTTSTVIERHNLSTAILLQLCFKANC